MDLISARVKHCVLTDDAVERFCSTGPVIHTNRTIDSVSSNAIGAVDVDDLGDPELNLGVTLSILFYFPGGVDGGSVVFYGVAPSCRDLWSSRSLLV